MIPKIGSFWSLKERPDWLYAVTHVGDNYVNLLVLARDGEDIFDETQADLKGWSRDFVEIREEVNHPEHYHPGTYEAIKVIEAWGLGFNLGNVVKYIARAGNKGDRKQDLKEALWYLERELA